MRRLPALVLVALLGALLPTSPASAAPGPSVSITSPAKGASVPAAPLQVTATGTTASGDIARGMTLYVDGLNQWWVDCPSGSTTTCTLQLTADFTGGWGTHTLQVEFATQNTGAATMSPSVTVTVQSAPTATLTAPTDGATVNGQVQVALNGLPDPAKDDIDLSIDVLVDGAQVANLPCDSGVGGDCGGGVTYTWDTTGLSGQHTLQGRLHTQLGDTALSPLVTVTVAGTPPTASISSPAGGASITGVTWVNASGEVTATGDGPAHMELLVDGVLEDTRPCPSAPPTPKTCPVALYWDSTGRTGQHALTAYLATTAGAGASSAPVTVSVTTPPPTATVTSPAGNTTVSGTIVVNTRSTNDARLSDVPVGMDLLVDGTVVMQQACAAVAIDRHACYAPFEWSTGGLTGAHQLQTRVRTRYGDTATSAAVPITVGSGPAPTATITSPAEEATVSGVVAVQANGQVTATGDGPATMQLFVDGSPVDTQPCPSAPATPNTCPVTLRWDSTGQIWGHLMTVHLVTTSGAAADSAVIYVLVPEPPPTATVTSPTSGSVVSGAVTVTATGATNSRLTDLPTGMDLLVDGTVTAYQACPATGDPNTCRVSFAWSTTGLTGTHHLQTRVRTRDGLTALSASVPVIVYSSTRTTLTALPIVLSGTTETVKGRVITTANGVGLAGRSVRLTFRPTVGTARAVTVTTGANGYFSASLKAVVNTTVTASVTARPGYGASTATTTARVRARFTCALSSSTVRHGSTAKGACKIAALPVGTAWTLKAYVNGRWVALKTGKATSTTIAFSFAFSRAGTYPLRLVLGASRPYVASVGPTLKVIVT